MLTNLVNGCEFRTLNTVVLVNQQRSIFPEEIYDCKLLKTWWSYRFLPFDVGSGSHE